MYGAKTLLGTATPSIETWQNATDGKYGFLLLISILVFLVHNHQSQVPEREENGRTDSQNNISPSGKRMSACFMG